MKNLFVLLLVLTVNISFSQVINLTDSIKKIINIYNYDTTSNIVINYIKEHVKNSSCNCLPSYDEKTNTIIEYGVDNFLVNGLGEVENARVYLTYFDSSVTEQELINILPIRLEEDFQKLYTQKGYDFFRMYDSENFNYKFFEFIKKEDVSIFDPETFDVNTEIVHITYKALIIISYNN
jgi:hypothetical protein